MSHDAAEWHDALRSTARRSVDAAARASFAAASERWLARLRCSAGSCSTTTPSASSVALLRVCLLCLPCCCVQFDLILHCNLCRPFW